MTEGTEAGPREGRKGLPRKAVVFSIVALLVIMMVAAPFVFLESRVLDIHERRDVPMVPDANRIEIDVTASVGELEVYFAPLDGKAAEVLAEVEGKASYFGGDEPLNLTLEHTSEVGEDGNVTIKANVSFNAYAPWPYYSLDRTHFTVVVNESLRTKLDLKMTTGGISVTTAPGVVLEGLRLNATSEGAAVTFNNGTTLAGDVNIRTATGGTQFRWYNVNVTNYPTVTLSESSGIINMTIRQHCPMNGSVNVTAVDVMGDIELRLDLSGEVNQAMISSKKGDVFRSDGFQGTLPPSLRTYNYYDPDAHRMNVQLNNTMGGIMVDGRWTA